MAVYILHFKKKFHHCQHYVGWTKENSLDAVKKRFGVHKAGNGSKLLRSVFKSGIKVEIATVFVNGNQKLERKIKNTKNVKKYCSFCNNYLIDYGD